MVDLRVLLGGTFVAGDGIELSPETQLIDAMISAGLVPPATVALDGRVHRFSSSGKRGKKDGWYVAYRDGVPAGRFGCWRTGVDERWRAKMARELTAQEEAEFLAMMHEAQRLRDIEAVARHELASGVVTTIWDGCAPASIEHPYLERKGILAHDLRVTGDGRLVAPVYVGGDLDELASLQYIDGDGGKLFHPGGEITGNWTTIGEVCDDTKTIYVAEGYATAATVAEVANAPCVVAYSASNLVPVVGSIREIHGPNVEIVIVADNDKGGVGQRYAEQASAKHGARFVVPPILGDANDYVKAGRNLAELLVPRVGDWLVGADDFSSEPVAISWLVKGWLQASALVMVHGPSGGGKTFVVLDWCCHMAAGLPTWNGVKVKSGPVIYLAGEGHHGLRGRIAAWKTHHKVDRLAQMWVSRDGCDLDTAAGLKRVLDNVRALQVRPAVIVVDTLHRFLKGDENSAQDAKAMLDACSTLQAEFQCSVLLVHHTGVNEEAQGRARGSSAWRGALDIEISIVPGKDGGPLGIVQRKSKDAEMVAPTHMQLSSVEIPGWIDEDGKPVTSAVLMASEAPPEVKRDSPIEKHRKLFENAWWASGAELACDGSPYISKSALRDYMITNDGISESAANQRLKASAEPGRMIRDMLDFGYLKAHENGWCVCDDGHRSRLVLARSTR